MTIADINYPKRSRDINNVLMDTKRWDGFEFRDGDIVINTRAAKRSSGRWILRRGWS